jgi:DNA-binding NarL/FixJ family response regulator
MSDDHDPEMVVEADVVSVLIVDDQAPFRLAARAVLRRTAGFELVGEAADGDEAVERARKLRPALVLMDINMPTMNGIEATRQIMAEAPDTTVFLCSTYQRSDLPPEAESSGFAAYVHKEELAPDLLRRLWDDRAAT